jgi:plastocyanin
LGTIALVGALVACSEDDDDGIGPGDAETIEMQDFSFDPDPLTIDVGTAVRWVNEGNVPHNTRSETQVWSSANLQPGQSFEHTFATAGTFLYECTLHPGMDGTIIVQ